jgi:putative endonuclease
LGRFSRGRALGPEGERAARAYLEARGLRALGASVRTPFGEIDLALEDPATGAVVIAEVKARAGRDFGTGAESVTPRKRERLRKAALHFLSERGLGDRPVRFDVVALAVGADGSAKIEHFEGAFAFDG